MDTENKAKKVANSGKDPRNLTDIDGDLFYSATSEAGREPWFIDNNKMAIQLQDINPGLRSSNPSNFQLIKREIKDKTQDFLYFSANDGQRGSELWNINLSRKDKRAQRLEDLYSGPAGSDPRQLTNSNQELFFTANDGKSGRELWTIGIEIESPSGGEDNWQSIVKVSEKQTFVYTFSTDKGSAVTSTTGQSRVVQTVHFLALTSRRELFHSKQPQTTLNPRISQGITITTSSSVLQMKTPA